MAKFLRVRAIYYRGLAIVLTYCVAGYVPSAYSFSTPSTQTNSEKLSTQDKQALVTQAVVEYEQGKLDEARKGLEHARVAFPENHAAPYYLGLIYLEQGDRSAAISQWQDYVRMDPRSENALNIRKNITLLLRQQARELAIEALANEDALTSAPADEDTVAVTNFSNLGSDNLGALGKGMAAMLIADLSQFPDLRVVDRIRIQVLLEEMKLGASGLVASQTAPKIGKLLKAKHVTSGSLADVEKDSLMIASAVMDADQKTKIGTQEAKGMLKQFYDLEKQIACQVIKDLGKNCDTAVPGFHKIHTKSMPALVAYSKGLDHFDRKNYDQAREMFQKAIDEDPDFDLAKEALWATPTVIMASMSASQMISNASNSGTPSTAAGSAVSNTTVAGPAAETGTASMGVDIAGYPPKATTPLGKGALAPPPGSSPAIPEKSTAKTQEPPAKSEHSSDKSPSVESAENKKPPKGIGASAGSAGSAGAKIGEGISLNAKIAAGVLAVGIISLVAGGGGGGSTPSHSQ